MANTSSAKKQARESIKRAERNRSAKSAVKTHVVRVRRAVSDGTTYGIDALALTAIKSLDRAASKGILHPNNAARRKSRLMKRLAAAQVATPAKTQTKPTGRRAAGAVAASAAKPATRSTKTKKTT